MAFKSLFDVLEDSVVKFEFFAFRISLWVDLRYNGGSIQDFDEIILWRIWKEVGFFKLFMVEKNIAASEKKTKYQICISALLMNMPRKVLRRILPLRKSLYLFSQLISVFRWKLFNVSSYWNTSSIKIIRVQKMKFFYFNPFFVRSGGWRSGGCFI